MNITRCPLRIGLAGGSTDLESFIQMNEYGSVINFPIDLYTYTLTHKDVLGLNSLGKYIINYSTREECDNIEDIKNNIARIVLDNFEKEPCMIAMTSDLTASGSGLASSSSYTVSMIKTVSESVGIKLSNYDCCKLALNLERQFNPLTGYQDPYGCGMGGLKRLHFYRDKDPQIEYLPTEIFDNMDMYLISTDTRRSSTEILKGVESNQPVIKSLLSLVDDLEKSIKVSDVEEFSKIINEGWLIKKKASNKTTSPQIESLDNEIISTSGVLSRRLCGAGGGGFFLAFCEKGYSAILRNFPNARKVNIDVDGVKGLK